MEGRCVPSEQTKKEESQERDQLDSFYPKRTIAGTEETEEDVSIT